jgi:hypothetical protein
MQLLHYVAKMTHLRQIRALVAKYGLIQATLRAQIFLLRPLNGATAPVFLPLPHVPIDLKDRGHLIPLCGL